MVQNAIIRKVELETIGHFGNVVCVTIHFDDRCIGYRQNTANCGYVIRTLIEVLGLTAENGIALSDIRNIPCRIDIDEYDNVSLIMHPTLDRCISIESLFSANKDSIRWF